MARKTKQKKPLMVLSRHGRYRFQSGLITGSLLRHGFDMDDAMAIARSVRSLLENTRQISSDELKEHVEQEVCNRLGKEASARLRLPKPSSVPLIQSERGTFPFSKGVLLRRLDTAGLQLDEAVPLVNGLESWVRNHANSTLRDGQLDDEMYRLLCQGPGETVARRYKLLRWIRESKRPVIILIGGATGCGKSTLATDLASRLGVVWVTSTDMIRETMRTVLSAELVPGLHDHSFRGMVLGGQALSDPRERVLAGFRQQAEQVAIGVRAVIRRAVREQAHIIIEGTHIVPPFMRYLDNNAEAHIAGLLLSVPDEVQHRARFPARAEKQSKRKAHPYLDAFQSVRWIHDDLLAAAEEVETVVFDNADLEETLTSVIDFLSRELPINENMAHSNALAKRSSEEISTLFLLLDGLSDEPSPALGNQTPLQAANTPRMDRLAGGGGQGQIVTTRDGGLPSTDEGILSLLGAPDELSEIGRGLFEALGLGIPLPVGSVVFRGNLATRSDDGSIVDRRAGRIRSGVHDLLGDLGDLTLSNGIIGRVFAGHEHRVIVMLQGKGLSGRIADTDPGDQAAIRRRIPAGALTGSKKASRTAAALNELLALTDGHLEQHSINKQRIQQGLAPANCILTRGAAKVPERSDRNFSDGAMVSACPTARGIAGYLGMTAAHSDRMTGNLDSDLSAKFHAAAELLAEHSFVTLHIKGTDIAAHDKRPNKKKMFIEKVDAALGSFLDQHKTRAEGLRIVVSADHGTSSRTGHHLPDPVPLLLGIWSDQLEEEEEFNEDSAAHGALGLLEPGQLRELLTVSGKATSLESDALHSDE